jgi:hypothetical protein
MASDKNAFIQSLLQDREAFEAYVYTPWSEAITELDRRKNDVAIEEFVSSTIPHGLPVVSEKPLMVLFRNIATPNYETIRFIISSDVLSECEPIIFEHTHDIFADINELKRALAKLCFYKGFNKLKQPMVEYRSIVDITTSNSKPLDSITTHWGESLVEFHHALLHAFYPKKVKHINISPWLATSGSHAQEYYKSFLTLFLKHGVLFENFMIHTAEERRFSEMVILPLIIEIEEKTGKKPLIVALEPTEIEGDHFWLSYPKGYKDFVVNRATSV